MFKHPVIISIVFILILVSGRSWAEKAYVTDTITITFRTGPSMDNRVIDTLRSGEPVQLLETQEEWSRVQIIEDGETKTGWVLSRYLMTRLPFEQQANELQKEINPLREKLSSVERKLNDKTVQVNELTKKLEETSKAFKNAEKQYELLKKEAADYLAVKKANDAAQSELLSIRKDLESMTTKYTQLKSSKDINWLMTGAGVLLCGLFMGLILGRREKKRKSYYY
jgi:SH3 domain protein